MAKTRKTSPTGRAGGKRKASAVAAKRKRVPKAVGHQDWCRNPNLRPRLNKGSRKYPRTFAADDDAESDDDAEESGNVSALGSHIFFYAEVNVSNVATLNKLIRKCGIKNSQSQCGSMDFNPEPIYLHINSPGGDVFSALAAVDTIITSPVRVITIVEGLAASAATLISVVGAERWITPHASMLVHQLSSGFWGKLVEIQDEFTNLEYLEEKTKALYIEHCKGKMPAKKLEKWLKRDIYFDVNTCIEFGLVDWITTCPAQTYASGLDAVGQL